MKKTWIALTVLATLPAFTCAQGTHLDIMVPDRLDTDLAGPVKSVDTKTSMNVSGKFEREHQEYDRIGNLLSETEWDPEGECLNTLTNHYDDNNTFERQVYIDYEDGFTNKWDVFLNPDTRQIAMKKKSGSATVYTYSPAGYLIGYRYIGHDKKLRSASTTKRDENNRRIEYTRMDRKKKPRYTYWFRWKEGGFIDRERQHYRQEEGERLHIYDYLKTDSHENWTQRLMARYDIGGKKRKKVYERLVARSIEYFEPEEVEETEPPDSTTIPTETEPTAESSTIVSPAETSTNAVAIATLPTAPTKPDTDPPKIAPSNDEKPPPEESDTPIKKTDESDTPDEDPEDPDTPDEAPDDPDTPDEDPDDSDTPDEAPEDPDTPDDEKEERDTSDDESKESDTPDADKEALQEELKAQFDYTFDDISKQLVIISCKSDAGRSAGSGFVAKMQGRTYLFTNQHVIMGADTIRLKTAEGETLTPRRIELSKTRDIARILIDEREGFEICEKFAMGIPVGVFGNSEGAGVATELFGEVTDLGVDLVEVTAEFVSGNSGSPVLNKDQEVIGIASYVRVIWEPSSDDEDEEDEDEKETEGEEDEEDKRKSKTRRFCYRLTDLEWQSVNWKQYNNKYGKLYRNCEAMSDNVFRLISIWSDAPLEKIPNHADTSHDLAEWIKRHNDIIDRYQRRQFKKKSFLNAYSESLEILSKTCHDRSRRARMFSTQRELTGYLRKNFLRQANSLKYAGNYFQTFADDI